MRANPLTQVTRVDQNTDPGDRRVKQTDRQTDVKTERMKYYIFDVKHNQKDKENRVLNEGTIQRPVLLIYIHTYIHTYRERGIYGALSVPMIRPKLVMYVRIVT